MSTPFDRLLMVETQPNIALPPYNCENPKVLHLVFPIVYRNLFIAHPYVDRTLTLFNVHIQSPEIKDGKYPYREHITVWFSLTWPTLRQYKGVVLVGPALPDQLWLRCYAVCSSCISSLNPKCNPTDFYLNPECDRTHNQNFKLDWSSDTFTGIVTYNIEHRPRRPKPNDQTRRCADEALT